MQVHPGMLMKTLVGVRGMGYPIRDTGCGTRGAAYGIRDTGYGKPETVNGNSVADQSLVRDARMANQGEFLLAEITPEVFERKRDYFHAPKVASFKWALGFVYGPIAGLAFADILSALIWDSSGSRGVVAHPQSRQEAAEACR